MAFEYLKSAHGVLLALLLVGCSSTSQVDKTEQKATKKTAKNMANLRDYQLAPNKRFARVASSETKDQKDRAAILAMQGEYDVNFDFKETVILKKDYERFPSKQANANEAVIVVENAADRIVLQHILVMGDTVIKHWRQDWYFEADKRFEFSSNQTWKVKDIPAAMRQGQWTQCVYEVSDAPRYCGTGKWNHRYGVSTWTSDRSWRPLPRREYTVRDDYNALNAENRHTVTPHGWTHEQDNTKVVRAGEGTEATLVREFGFNDYRNIAGYDFSPGYQYWEKTAPYWAMVRDVWTAHFDKDRHVVINTDVDGMPVIEATFKQAAAIAKGQALPQQQDVESMLSEWVNSISDTNKLTLN